MIKGKRAFLANILYRTGAHYLCRRLYTPSLVIFNYHRIKSNEPGNYLFDDGVYGPTQEELRTQLNWLKLNANIISEQDLIDHLGQGKKLRQSSVMITFDDGYKDNADLALPILKELKIPAIFFICTGAIEERTLGWWDTIAYLLKHTKHSKITLRGRHFDLLQSRESAITELHEWMRTQYSAHTRFLVNEISAAADAPLPASDLCSQELMSWEQIKEVSDAGISIGSHTHTHRVLSTLNRAEQLSEFRLSKKILERKLNIPIRSVAYPVGGFDDCHLETGELAEDCGYELGFTFQTGFNRLKSISPFNVRRVSAEEGIPLTCAAISLPSIFARSRTGDRPTRSVSHLPSSPFSSSSILSERLW